MIGVDSNGIVVLDKVYGVLEWNCGDMIGVVIGVAGSQWNCRWQWNCRCDGMAM
jgi:hypothetical protein